MPKSGRKRIYEDPMDAYNIRLTANQARKSRKLGGGNMAKGARRAIEEADWPDVFNSPRQRRCTDNKSR